MGAVSKLVLYCLFLLNSSETSHGLYTREVQYVGCMARRQPSALDKQVDTEGELAMSVQRCVTSCWYERYRVAGIQEERKCFCSQNAKGLNKKPDKECNKRCTGNCYQACGGANVLSVYRTGYVREPTFVMEKRAFLPAFIGCYDSRTALNILCPNNYEKLVTKRMTIPLCIYYCDSIYQTKFSTVSATDKCCCSDSVHGTRNTVLAWCDFHGTPCDGDKKQGCIGSQEKTFQWSTHVRARLPKFKRWPPSTFKKADWIHPNFKAGEEYHIKEIGPQMDMSAGDATLLGLMAKSSRRNKGMQGKKEETGKDEDEGEVKGMVGADKREPKDTGLKESAAVADLPKKRKRGPVVEEEAEKEKEGNTGMVVALILGFLVLLGGASAFMYSQKQKAEAAKKANKNGGNGKELLGDAETDDEDDDDAERGRRRSSRKKKKKKKKKKRRKDEDEDETTAEDDDNLIESED